MAHLNYDNNIITQAPAGAASCAEPRQQDRGMPVARRWSALADHVQRRAFLARVSKFLLVGGIGALVNSLALLLLFQRAHLPLVLASVLSAEVAIIHNFCWNDRWTFRRTRLSLRRFAKFNLVSLAGLVITICTLWLLVEHLGVYYLAANLLSIGLATAWNFAVNVVWTWGGAR